MRRLLLLLLPELRLLIVVGRCTQYPPPQPPALAPLFSINALPDRVTPRWPSLLLSLGSDIKASPFTVVSPTGRPRRGCDGGQRYGCQTRTFGPLVFFFHRRSHKKSTEQTVDVTTTMRRVSEHLTLHETPVVKSSSRTAVIAVVCVRSRAKTTSSDGGTRLP